MIRSRWNKVTNLPRRLESPNKPAGQRRSLERIDLLDKLIEERQALIFAWVEAAERQVSSFARRLVGLLLAASLLLAGTALVAGQLQARAAPTGSAWRLVFGLSLALAALLLVLSIILNLRGLAPDSGSSLSLGTMDPGTLRSSPREQLVRAALARLKELKEADRRLRRVFRWAAIFFIAALIPYLLGMGLLLF